MKPSRANLLSVREGCSAHCDLCVLVVGPEEQAVLPTKRAALGQPGTETNALRSSGKSAVESKLMVPLPACLQALTTKRKPNFSAVVCPVASLHKSTIKTRATATIARLRARAPLRLLVKMASQGFTARQSG